MRIKRSVGDMMFSGYKYYIIFEIDNNKKVYRVFEPSEKRVYSVDINSVMDIKWKKVA